MRVLCSGKTSAFQADDASSILATRSIKIHKFYLKFKYSITDTLDIIKNPPNKVVKLGRFSRNK